MDYNNLYQQYSAFTDPFGFREEEDAVGNARPVTQTIKTDPITGEQTMTIKGSPQDLSAANPLTPTVVMPGQPSGAGGFLGGYEDMAPAVPARPQMAAPQAPMPATDNRNIVPLEQPAAGGYDPEQMAQVLQQAGLNYQQPQPIATLAQAGTSDMNPPVIPQRPEPTGAGGFLGATEDMAPAPAAPVAPAEAFPRPQAATQPTAPAAAVAPGSDEYTQRMLAELRKREGNYDSPPHAASSAQGAYGITAPAYSDIQRADPYFANRPQGQLSPADQDRAALVLRGLNQERLRSQGVEPTEANQQLAHFLGPKGAADYLATGYISPEAAAANGGVEKVRQIAEERLALGRQLSGQAGPAVAGVGREMGMGEPGYGGAGTMPAVPSKTPWMDTVLNLQDNTEGLAAYVGNPDNPKEARDAASLILKSRYKQEDLTNQAQKMVRDAIQTGDWKTLERLMKPTPRQKREDEDGITLGGIAKAFLYSAIGFQSGAQDVVDKMGVGARWTSTTIGDDEVTALVRKDGSAIEGQYTSGSRAGQALDKDELKSIAGSSLPKGVHISKTETMVDPATGQIVSHQILSNGTEKFTVGGKTFTGDRKALVPERQFSAAEDRRVNTALEALRRNVPNPTQQQIQQALVAARVPNRRVEQEMGLEPGSLGTGRGRTTVGGGQPSGAGAVAPEPQLGTGAGPQPGAAVITPELQPEPPVLRDILPGENKTAYEAYKKREDDAYKKRLEAYQNRVKLEQTEAQAFRERAINTRSQLRTIKDAVGIVKSGEYLLGPLFGTEGSKFLPKAQEFFASKFGDQTTTDNTRALRSLITKGGLEGIKDYMGPSISNFDVQAWLKANPITEQSSPQALEKYFTKLYNTLHDLSEQKRANAVKHGMIEPSFSLGSKIDTGSAERQRTPQELAQEELRRRQGK